MDLAPGTSLDVFAERLNRAIFRIEDENGESVSQTLEIQRGDTTYTITVPDTVVLRSAGYVVAALPNAHVANFDPETYQGYSRSMQVLRPYPGSAYTVDFCCAWNGRSQ